MANAFECLSNATAEQLREWCGEEDASLACAQRLREAALEAANPVRRLIQHTTSTAALSACLSAYEAEAIAELTVQLVSECKYYGAALQLSDIEAAFERSPDIEVLAIEGSVELDAALTRALQTTDRHQLRQWCGQVDPKSLRSATVLLLGAGAAIFRHHHDWHPATLKFELWELLDDTSAETPHALVAKAYVERDRGFGLETEDVIATALRKLGMWSELGCTDPATHDAWLGSREPKLLDFYGEFCTDKDLSVLGW